jgi:TRAP-type C4-dicarboxylate transport system permease small subunit
MHDAEPTGWVLGISRLTKWFDRVGRVVLAAMMVLTTTDVLLRKLMDRAILGGVEMTELMMVVIVFFALAHTEVYDGHIKVDLIVGRLSRRGQAAADCLTQFLAMGLVGLMTSATIRQAGHMRSGGEVTLDLGLPVWPFVYLAALGCLLLTAVLAIRFVVAVRGVLTK